MSNNELYEHKRSDTVKWVLTLFAFILVGVMLAGIILGWFDKKDELPVEEEQTEQAAVTDGEGNAMDEDTVYPMPEKMSFSAAVFAQPLAQFGEPTGTVTVTYFYGQFFYIAIMQKYLAFRIEAESCFFPPFYLNKR